MKAIVSASSSEAASETCRSEPGRPPGALPGFRPRVIRMSFRQWPQASESGQSAQRRGPRCAGLPRRRDATTGNLEARGIRAAAFQGGPALLGGLVSRQARCRSAPGRPCRQTTCRRRWPNASAWHRPTRPSRSRRPHDRHSESIASCSMTDEQSTLVGGGGTRERSDRDVRPPATAIRRELAFP